MCDCSSWRTQAEEEHSAELERLGREALERIRSSRRTGGAQAGAPVGVSAQAVGEPVVAAGADR